MTSASSSAHAEHPPVAAWPARLGVLSVSHTIIDAYGAFLAPIVALVLAPKFGLTDAGAANLLSLYVGVLSLGQIFFGYLSDRLGGRWMTLLAPAVTGLTAGSFLLAPSLPLLLVMILGAALAIAAYHPEAVALSGEIGGTRRATSTAIFLAAGPVGLSFGPVLVTWAARQPQPPVWLPFLGVAVSVALLVALPRGLTHLSAPTGPEDSQNRSIFAALRQAARPLSLLASISALRYCAVTGLNFGVPLVLVDRMSRQEALETSGWWLALFLGASALGGILGSSLTGRHARTSNVVSFGVAAPLVVLVPLLPTAWGWLPLTGAGLALGWTNPLIVALGHKAAPGATASVSALLLGGAWSIGGPVAPKLFEILRSAVSSTAAVWTLAGLSLVAGLLALRLPKRPAKQ